MTDARLWHPWLRINRVLRVMLQTRWNGEAWLVSVSSSAGRPRCGTRFGMGWFDWPRAPTASEEAGQATRLAFASTGDHDACAASDRRPPDDTGRSSLVAAIPAFLSTAISTGAHSRWVRDLPGCLSFIVVENGF